MSTAAADVVVAGSAEDDAADHEPFPNSVEVAEETPPAVPPSRAVRQTARAIYDAEPMRRRDIQVDAPTFAALVAAGILLIDRPLRFADPALLALRIQHDLKAPAAFCAHLAVTLTQLAASFLPGTMHSLTSFGDTYRTHAGQPIRRRTLRFTARGTLA